MVTMHYDPATWSDDLKHLNEEGHRQLATSVLAHMEAAAVRMAGGAPHSGSGAAWSGISTRNGDLLTLFVKNAPANSTKMMVTCHFEVVARISAQGCDLLD